MLKVARAPGSDPAAAITPLCTAKYNHSEGCERKTEWEGESGERERERERKGGKESVCGEREREGGRETACSIPYSNAPPASPSRRTAKQIHIPSLQTQMNKTVGTFMLYQNNARARPRAPMETPSPAAASDASPHRKDTASSDNKNMHPATM